LPCPEKLLFLNIDNCGDRFFFREEIKEKIRSFKNLVKLTPNLEKYKKKEERTESYSNLLSSAANDLVNLAKEKGQE